MSNRMTEQETIDFKISAYSENELVRKFGLVYQEYASHEEWHNFLEYFFHYTVRPYDEMHQLLPAIAFRLEQMAFEGYVVEVNRDEKSTERTFYFKKQE